VEALDAAFELSSIHNSSASRDVSLPNMDVSMHIYMRMYTYVCIIASSELSLPNMDVSVHVYVRVCVSMYAHLQTRFECFA
jgi:hypothetical protein